MAEIPLPRFLALEIRQFSWQAGNECPLTSTNHLTQHHLQVQILPVQLTIGGHYVARGRRSKALKDPQDRGSALLTCVQFATDAGVEIFEMIEAGEYLLAATFRCDEFNVPLPLGRQNERLKKCNLRTHSDDQLTAAGRLSPLAGDKLPVHCPPVTIQGLLALKIWIVPQESQALQPLSFQEDAVWNSF